MNLFLRVSISDFTAPFRFDRTNKEEGILLYIGEDIHSKLVRTHYIYDHTECLEINLHNIKWHLIGSYSPLKSNKVL